MEKNDKAVKARQDVKVNFKSKLSALWVALMFLYLYADVLGFYGPGVIAAVSSGELGALRITPGLLLVMAVWMAVPSTLAFLSLTLPAKANRITNIVAGIASLVVLVVASFAGRISVRYLFQAVIEAALIVAIVLQVWKWPLHAGKTPEVAPAGG